MVRIGSNDNNSNQYSKTELNKTSSQNANHKLFKTLQEENNINVKIDLLTNFKTKTPSTYSIKITEEETNIHNIIDRAKEPLKRPNENPTIVLDAGPHGGKLEQFPQRANGTYRTIETLPNGETYESTYSQTGNLLNEIKRNDLDTQVTTFNGIYTDKVNIGPLNGNFVIGKIQAGNFIMEKPPTLQEITGKELDGFLMK